VVLLTHAELLPPAGARPPGRTERVPPWATEHAVAQGLQRLGHDVRFVGLDDELLPLDTALDAFRPDVVFNLLEEFDDRPRLAAHVVAYLEALGYPVTGCSAEGLMLTGDKALARPLLAAHGVHVAAGFVVPRGGTPRIPRGLGFPLVVKSATDHGSAGLTQASVVRTARALANRVQALHRALGSDALVERYVAGRELYVTVLGGRRSRALPPCELHRESRSARPWVASERLKEDPAFQRRHGFVYGLSAPLASDLGKSVARTARTACAALRITGLARVDLRLPPGAAPVVLEVNPNPDLNPHGEVVRSARAAGLTYGTLLTMLLRDAAARVVRR
jgi:D-alanine-D-alanine ligase